MKTYRELLELAAKAAGDIEVLGYHHQKGLQIGTGVLRWVQYWNPLTDDGDALRLAVRLGITVEPYLPERSTIAYLDSEYHNNKVASPEEPFGDDPYAATRRAIVRAAAEIGKGMK